MEIYRGNVSALEPDMSPCRAVARRCGGRVNSDSAQSRQAQPRRKDWRQADRLLLSTGQRGGLWTWVLALATLVGSGAALLLPAAIGRALDALPGGGHVTWTLLACAGLIVIMVG